MSRPGQARAGDGLGALDHYIRSLDIVVRLADFGSGSGYLRDLAVSLERVGDVRAAGGDAQGALDHYNLFLQIIERLAALDPAHSGHQNDPPVNACKVASVLQSAGDPSSAEYWARTKRLRELSFASDYWGSATKLEERKTSDAAAKLLDSDQSYFDYVAGKRGPK